jgi:hypothetical protein
MGMFPVSRLNGFWGHTLPLQFSDDGIPRHPDFGKAHGAKDSGRTPPATLDFKPETGCSKIEKSAVFS